MKQYVSPTIEFISFEHEISIQTAGNSLICNCAAEQYNNNTSILEGCELTSYGFIEVGNHY